MSYVLPLPSLVVPVPVLGQRLIETNLKHESSAENRGQEDDIPSEDRVVETASDLVASNISFAVCQLISLAYTSHSDDGDQCADVGEIWCEDCCARHETRETVTRNKGRKAAEIERRLVNRSLSVWQISDSLLP